MFLPLMKITPSYPYKQLYSNDPLIVPFFNTYNIAAQYYLDWYNQNPIAIYTSPKVSGLLLNFVARGLYGLMRPTISNITTTYGAAEMNSIEMNSQAMNGNSVTQDGTTEIVDDDIFKRMMTWHLYLGDGRQATMPWLRKRIARFIYGLNGADITNDFLQYVNLSFPSTNNIEIILATSDISEQFKFLLDQNWLAKPFQLNFTVTLI
jgi:hypothetical protein